MKCVWEDFLSKKTHLFVLIEKKYSERQKQEGRARLPERQILHHCYLLSLLKTAATQTATNCKLGKILELLSSIYIRTYFKYLRDI